MKEHRVNNKKMAILATGNEVLQGDIHDGNTEYFAKSITDLGGDIYQCIKTSDVKSEIVLALNYLFQSVDVVITTGGLGPTSDDITRFAIAEYFQQTLEFREEPWEHITNRLNRFQLKINESNRQQALFPANSQLIQNNRGSAWGAFIFSGSKTVMMLPGPPRECHPMFDENVLPWLKSHDFLGKKTIFRWMTLGLIEGEIAPEIDLLAKPFQCETGYRWHYPYLEIKTTVPVSEKRSVELTKLITERLSHYLIGQHAFTAEEVLKKMIAKNRALSTSIYILDELTQGELGKEYFADYLIWLKKSDKTVLQDRAHYVHIYASQPLMKSEYGGLIHLNMRGKIHNKSIHHELIIPHRKEIELFARAYVAWQIVKVIEQIC